MKSLQVLTPTRKCIFNCPFCIAKTHEHHNLFDNNYKEKYDFWRKNYINILNINADLKTIVITGTNEPMQDQEYVKDVIQITFKILHDSKGSNLIIDEWIKNNKTSLSTVKQLKNDIKNYHGKLSIMFDENCMEAEDRYMVFREDGLLYKDFDSNKPVEI